MRSLTIYRLFFTDSKCYHQGTIQAQHGVQVHSTGANNPCLKRYVQPDDGRLGKNIYNNSHNNPKGTVCANAYIGKLQDGPVAVYQTLPWDMRCWLSGQGRNGNGNRMGYIGFEICEDNCENRAYFQEAVMDKAVLLTAYLCQMLNVEPWTVVQETPDGPAYAVMDHISLHNVGCASNHGDIGLWMRKFGMNFEDFRRAVDDALDEGVDVTYIDAKEGTKMDHPTLRRGDTGPEVLYLQTLLSDVGTPIKGDGIFGPATAAAVRVFQASHGLKTDCIVGPETWAALEKATAHDENETNPAPDPEPEAQTVTMSMTDYNALKAAVAVGYQVVKKYEAMG